jgi:hypothetical protein
LVDIDALEKGYYHEAEVIIEVSPLEKRKPPLTFQVYFPDKTKRTFTIEAMVITIIIIIIIVIIILCLCCYYYPNKRIIPILI